MTPGAGIPPIHLLSKNVADYSDENWRQLATFVGLDPAAGDFAKLVARVKELIASKSMDNPIEIIGDPQLLGELREITAQFRFKAPADAFSEYQHLLK